MIEDLKFEAIKGEASRVFGITKPFPFLLRFGFNYTTAAVASTNPVIGGTIPELPYDRLRLKRVNSSFWISSNGAVADIKGQHAHMLVLVGNGYNLGYEIRQITNFTMVPDPGVESLVIADVNAIRLFFGGMGEQVEPFGGLFVRADQGPANTYQETPPYIFSRAGFLFSLEFQGGFTLDVNTVSQYRCEIEFEVIP